MVHRTAPPPSTLVQAPAHLDARPPQPPLQLVRKQAVSQLGGSVVGALQGKSLHSSGSAAATADWRGRWWALGWRRRSFRARQVLNKWGPGVAAGQASGLWQRSRSFPAGDPDRVGRRHEALIGRSKWMPEEEGSVWQLSCATTQLSR